MTLTRDHFFFLGVFLILWGVEFRLVETFVLSEKASQVVMQRWGLGGQSAAAARADWPLRLDSRAGNQRFRWTPPEWLGWALLSIGSVLVLHSLAMPKPGS